MIDFVQRDAGARLRRARSNGSPIASASRSSTRRPRRRRTAAAGAASRLLRRCSTRRRRSTSATSGTRRPARSRATTWRGAASARRSAASSGSGSRSAGSTLARKALEKGFTRGRAARGRAHAAARRRLLPAPAAVPARRRARPRARLPGAAPARGRPAARRSTSTRPSPSSSTRARSSTGSTRRARRSRARTAPCVVEGNTDVIALRQAGFEPVVACMGTALTEQQLRELGRLTKRLWLAFDGDAAGESATLRGMELAAAQGFDVKVVALPPGIDPADDPAGFEARLATALPYVLYRTQVEARREEDREAGRRIVTAFLERRAGVARPAGRVALGERLLRHADPAPRRRHRQRGDPAVAPARARRRPARAGRARRRHRLSEPPPAARGDHARALPRRDVPRAPRAPRRRHAARRPGARAARRARRRGPGEGIDEPTAKEFLLRLRERALWAELQQADLARTKELREALARIQEAVAALGEGGATAN